MKWSLELVVVLVMILGVFGTTVFLFADFKNDARFSEYEAGFEPVHVHDDEHSHHDNQDTEDSVASAFDSLRQEIQSEEPPRSRRSLWAWYWRPMTAAEKEKYGTVTRTHSQPHIGIQVGHWNNTDVPDELSGLTRSRGGAQGGGKSEVDVVYDIAVIVKDKLEAQGVIVDLLPATVPIDYVADAFISIHADGSNSPSVNGFKIAGPRRDFSGHSKTLVESLDTAYADATGLARDSNITRRMSSYYAFNWRRYDHAIHPLTPAAIVETGFMTNADDRSVIVAAPEKAAQGIADGIIEFLESNTV